MDRQDSKLGRDSEVTKPPRCGTNSVSRIVQLFLLWTPTTTNTTLPCNCVLLLVSLTNQLAVSAIMISSHCSIYYKCRATFNDGMPTFISTTFLE